MHITADRGGPFVRSTGTARNWMRAAAPGIAFRFPSDESSPIGGAGSGARESCTNADQGSGTTRASAITRTISAGPARIVSDPAASRNPGATSVRNTSDHVPRGAGNVTRFGRAIAVAGIALLVAAGAASLGRGLYIHAKAQLAQVLLHAAWDRTHATGIATRPWPWADTHPVARLIAPGQDADVLVLAGASGRTLAFGPGHLDGSAQPGDPGNAVITAHRDTHFRFLKDAGLGDVIVVERADGATRRFRVRKSYVADARDLRLPRDTLVPTLTLVTCYPFDALNPGGPLRYVVVAEAASPA
jgi:sortase A